MKILKRLVLVAALVTAVLGAGSAQADRLCVRGGFNRPPVSVSSDTVCVAVP